MIPPADMVTWLCRSQQRFFYDHDGRVRLAVNALASAEANAACPCFQTSYSVMRIRLFNYALALAKFAFVAAPAA
jgi:hypothetical protein